MKRGDIFLVKRPGSSDPRKQRLFIVVSRQALIDSQYSSVICAPVYSRDLGLSTEVILTSTDGVKKHCCVRCDGLVSLEKAQLTNFVASLRVSRVTELDAALRAALDLE